MVRTKHMVRTNHMVRTEHMGRSSFMVRAKHLLVRTENPYPIHALHAEPLHIMARPPTSPMSCTKCAGRTNCAPAPAVGRPNSALVKLAQAAAGNNMLFS